MKDVEVLVLYANRYHMIDKDTGELNEGCGVRYLFSTDLAPCSSDDSKGYRVGKSKLAYADYDKFDVIPGIYTADMDLIIASDGTVKANAKDFVFKRPFALAPEKK